MTPSILGILGWCVIGVGAALLAAALFKDRSRGRRRCPRCWYDMGGVPGLVCPECGRDARVERRLFRTRRRWKRVAIAALFIAFGWVTMSLPELHRGWERLIPTSVLVFIAEAAPASVDPAALSPALTQMLGPANTAPPLTQRERLTNEAWRRMQSGVAWQWQSQVFVGRILRGSNLAARDMIRFPAAWPLNEPLRIKLLQPPEVSMLSLSGRMGSGNWCTPISARSSDNGERNLDAIKTPTAASPIQLRLRHGNIALWTATLNPPVRIRGTVDTFLDRITDADAAVQAALRPRLLKNAHGNWVVEYHERDNSALWNGIDYGIDFRVEVLVADRVIGRTVGMVVWGQSDWPSPTESLIVFDDDRRGSLELAIKNPDQPVVLRITGAPDRAGLSYMNHPFNKPRPACWAGAFEVRVNPADPATPAS